MDKLRLFGSYPDMLQQLAQQLAFRATLNNYDVGSWVGYPLGDYVKAKNLERKIYFQLYSTPTPPFAPEAGQPWKVASITVPEPRRDVLENWELLKNSLGGKNGFKFGRWRATVYYKGGRQTVVQASTEDKALQIAAAVSKLSELDVVRTIATETKAVGEYAKGKRLEIKSITIYPGSYYVMVQDAWTPRQNGQVSGGNAKIETNEKDISRRRLKRIPLWTDKPPRNLKELVRKMLKY